MPKLVRVTLIKSPVSRPEKQRRTVKALGLRRVNHTREMVATPTVVGQIAAIPHLVAVEVVGDAPERTG
jgi:large subunit ribosomal protein L30